jgi:hypothetical protein
MGAAPSSCLHSCRLRRASIHIDFVCIDFVRLHPHRLHRAYVHVDSACLDSVASTLIRCVDYTSATSTPGDKNPTAPSWDCTSDGVDNDSSRPHVHGPRCVLLGLSHHLMPPQNSLCTATSSRPYPLGQLPSGALVAHPTNMTI